jgi:hypothetical protein
MAKTYALSFGTATLLAPNLVEVIVNEGVEMDLVMVREYHAFINKELATPCGTLINKKNSYSFTFEAELEISNLNKIKAIAAVVYNEAGRIATEFVGALPTHKQWNMKIFNDRQAALDWLHEQLHDPSATTARTG